MQIVDPDTTFASPLLATRLQLLATLFDISHHTEIECSSCPLLQQSPKAIRSQITVAFSSRVTPAVKPPQPPESSFTM